MRQIEELLNLRADPMADAAGVRAQAAAKLDEVDARIHRLEEIRKALETLIASCPGQGTLDCCSIMGALAAASGAKAGRRKAAGNKGRSGRSDD